MKQTDPHLHIIDHPIIADRMARLRDKTTPSEVFRRRLHDVSRILAIAATRSLPLTTCRIHTPLEEIEAEKLAKPAPLIVPILRAGLGLATGLQEILPEADTGHVGLFRDEETLKPVEYLVKLPKDLKRPIFICDPMLATAGSLLKTIEILLKRGANVKDISVIALLCAPEGIMKVRELYPGLSIFTAAVDSHLNDDGFIVPGLGDAGDRIFGTQGS